jgi:hypothetical protein
MRANWKELTRPVGTYWQHDQYPVWVVHYPATHRAAAHYQGYKAVERVPNGRVPFTVDNRRVGPEFGFKTLDEAMIACEATQEKQVSLL